MGVEFCSAHPNLQENVLRRLSTHELSTHEDAGLIIGANWQADGKPTPTLTPKPSVNLDTVTMMNDSPVVLSFCRPAVLSSCRPAVLSSCRPAVLSSCRPVVLPSCRPVVLSSCRPVVLSSCRPIVLSCHGGTRVTVGLMSRWDKARTAYAPRWVALKRGV
ncbi:hypothetical protein K504DRAFT_254813 [Pleomassaria siparia CBS 279.74]|uniref:Uncharacterized protein n=1 Tax=Pleomassaria siparia CBS 279.74 TaxID=1314801 RepID=A0A6G1KCR8_9PLEO|nr:hypothetical protein K504DRAFT_254813 [Pleomassaria siparia CBS 279.74]